LYSNLNETSSAFLVNRYVAFAEEFGFDLRGKTMLEIGVGATNSVGYGMVACCGVNYWAYEPYVGLNPKLDSRLKAEMCVKYPEFDAAKVNRIVDLKPIPDASVDFIGSSSVLEHVYELPALLLELKRVLKRDGMMVHVVDYRDHFFKYPYEFLCYSERVWTHCLSPGSLPRWRLKDHVELFEKAGFVCELRDVARLELDFAQIEPYIDAKFAHYKPSDLAVSWAVLVVRFADQNPARK
jgi:SAM-dependent methyltransferase